ncbi:MAG: hypothetical protein QOI15_2420 [Pseudonocardiales bacterium]|nr:hypothetical protein [Pseudonocardiales bacterium]
MIGVGLLAGAWLLAGAGAAKLWSPDAAAAMLRRAWRGAPRGSAARSTVRATGLVEIAVGGAVLLTGTRTAAVLLAGCYLAFLAVAARLLLTGQHGSCGCFGSTESPVGFGHLVVNTAAVAVAIAAAVRPPGAFGGLAGDSVLLGVVGVGQALLLAYLAFLSITALPALAAARRRLLETA